MTDPLETDPLLDPKQTGTTDGAAGETVLPGPPGGPQGGEPDEATPEYQENDLSAEEVELDDTLEADHIASIDAIGE